MLTTGMTAKEREVGRNRTADGRYNKGAVLNRAPKRLIKPVIRESVPKGS
jgi:hypothetical protein